MIFDQDRRFLDAWEQFSRVSGLFIDKSDMLHAIDSKSSPIRHPKWKTGVSEAMRCDASATHR